jgi:hypothetical protein
LCQTLVALRGWLLPLVFDEESPLGRREIVEEHLTGMLQTAFPSGRRPLGDLGRPTRVPIALLFGRPRRSLAGIDELNDRRKSDAGL